MKLGLINSAWAQAGRDTAYGIQMTKEVGFDTIDIFTDPLDIDIRERRLIKRECDRVGLPIVSICCVAVGLIDFNPSIQRLHVDRCKAYLDLVYEYEAKNLLLVLGEAVLITVIGGGLGLLTAWLFVQRGDPTGGMLPVFILPPRDLVVGAMLIVSLGLLAGALPALTAMPFFALLAVGAFLLAARSYEAEKARTLQPATVSASAAVVA